MANKTGSATTPLEAGAVARRGPASGPRLSRGQWRQLALITGVALAVFTFLRWLPTGTNLSHMDFQVSAANSIEFCDPANPQFIPVVAVASPVALTISAPPARAGEEVHATAILRTANGKAIATEDLLVVHTRRLHLLIADPALEDYQHVHPEPGHKPGEWSFSFAPKASGTYRVFADFTPAATNRGLYAHADLSVGPALAAAPGSSEARGVNSAAAFDPASEGEGTLLQAVERDGYRFTLTSAAQPIRAKQPADLKFGVTRVGGGAVSLLPVMDAFAHLVAFDQTRSGFAHLHPAQLDLTRPPDAQQPILDFRITIPTAGRYVIWAQVNLGGRETFVPFWFQVIP